MGGGGSIFTCVVCLAAAATTAAAAGRPSYSLVCTVLHKHCTSYNIT